MYVCMQVGTLLEYSCLPAACPCSYEVINQRIGYGDVGS